MDTLGDHHETRAFMSALKQRLNEWLGRLEAIESAVTADHGSAPKYYSDGGFYQFATLRMGILFIGSKVMWCDETLAAIDRRLALVRTSCPGRSPSCRGFSRRSSCGAATTGGVHRGGDPRGGRTPPLTSYMYD